MSRTKYDALAGVLAGTPVAPVIVFEDASRAVPVARALAKGGLSVVEITLRTACDPEAIATIANVT